MEETILFNHIPKTGGSTFRIILNRIYGQENVFFIKSTDLFGSLNLFRKLSSKNKNTYKVIAGHGAEYFSKFVNNPIRVTILRDPAELFFSQYQYLKNSPNSIFQKEVSKLPSIEEYLDFAIENGQDNLMTRYLSNSIDWLFDLTKAIPEMETEGDDLLQKAKKNLHQYQAVLNLSTFDAGVYVVHDLLGWKRIPRYRPSNKSDYSIGSNISDQFLIRLKDALRFDIELFQYFLDEKIDISFRVKKESKSFKLFKLRQGLINKIAK